MPDGAKMFGMKGDEAIAMYMAAVTVLAMMHDKNLQHHSVGSLEEATAKWHQFCTLRGIPVPTPKEALGDLQRQSKVKIL